MNTYIITRITDKAGQPCTTSPQTKQLGRRVCFCWPPEAGRSLMANYVGDVPGELLRIPHVAAVRPLVPDGAVVETADSVYVFEPAGQLSVMLRLAE